MSSYDRDPDVPSFGRIVWWAVCALVVFTLVGGALAWVVQGNDFFLYKVFAPRQENIRREVFENTKSYKQGMVQELQNLQVEYLKADKEHKQAIASIILQRSADFPEDQMPADLRQFIWGLKKERGLAR
jgi:hypothetical protein